MSHSIRIVIDGDAHTYSASHPDGKEPKEDDELAARLKQLDGDPRLDRRGCIANLVIDLNSGGGGAVGSLTAVLACLTQAGYSYAGQDPD